MARILILGGGFGGLMTAERLSKILGAEHQITLVSASSKFTFYPALVRLAFGACTTDELSLDLPTKLSEMKVRFVQGEVMGIKPDFRRVHVAGDDFNGEISYDYLVIALGRRLATEKIGGFFEHAHHLLGIKAAQKFGVAVEKFQNGNVVVGLAPDAYLPVPACETAFALAEKFKDQIDRKEISVSLIFPDSIKTAFGGADLHRKLEDALEKHRIKVITDFPIKEVTEKTIVSEENAAIDYDLLMLVPPFRGQAMLKNLGITDELGFIRVDNFMRVQNQNMANAFAVGDITAFTGPKLAYMAIRQAQTAVENIAAEIEGGTAQKIYHHEIAAVIDEGGADTIFLHYGVWDETLYHLMRGVMWSRLKNTHNPIWDAVNSKTKKSTAISSRK